MAAWTSEKQPFGANRAPLLAALSENADGTVVPLAADPATGRLLVNSTGGGGGSTVTLAAFGDSVLTPWTWTTATTLNTAQVLINNSYGYSTLILQVNPNASVATGAIIVEGSLDDTNWNPINVQQLNGETGLYPYNGTALNYVASTSIIYQVAVGGIAYVRVRLSTAITGAGGSVVHQATLSTSGIFGATSEQGVSIIAPQSGQAANVSGAGALYTSLILNGTSAPLDDTTNFGDGLSTGIAAVGGRLWNGTNYDRWYGNAANGAQVNVTTSVLPTGAAKSATFGAAFPTTGTPIGGTNGTNFEPFRVDGSGYLEVNVEVSALPANAAQETGGNLASIVSNQTNATQITKLSDGTNTANVVAGDTGYNGIAIVGGAKTMTFTTGTAGAQNILANTNVEGYSWIEVVFTSVGSGLALTGQFSTVSGGAYVTSSLWTTTGGGSPTVLGTAAGIVYAGPVRGNFFQITVSALASGTFAGTVTLRAVAPPQQSVLALASQNGTWTVGSNSATGSATPANAFYIGLNDGTNLAGWWDLQSRSTDGQSGQGIGTTGGFVYNGSNWDRQRSGVTTGSALAQAVQQDTIAATTTFTCTLASLASSTVGVGRQSTLLTGNTARSAIIGVQLTTGTTPTLNSLAYVYLIRGDGTLNDDAAGASDAALTVVNAPLLGTLLCPSATTGTILTGHFDTKFLGSLGPTWGIAIVNSTGAALNATAGNQVVNYIKLT